MQFEPPAPTTLFPQQKRTLKDAIFDLRTLSVQSLKNHSTRRRLIIMNICMVRFRRFIYPNRVRSWHEQSYTIQAGGRHAPIHPDAPKMIKIGKNKMKFVEGKESLYRVSVRECARIQTFPDTYKFIYNRVADGYKMIGNAVPVDFAEMLAKKIFTDLSGKF